MKPFKIVSLFMLVLASCDYRSEKHIKESVTIEKDTMAFSTDELSEIQNLIDESMLYTENRDIDGDSIADIISFDYSGGAHCCYSMSLKLSSKVDTIHYPFEMDGGYGFGIVDGSNHDHFNIADYDNDGLQEIFMGISTYNGEKYAIDKKWTKKYGIKSNYIIFDFQDDKIKLSDYDSSKYFIKHFVK